MSVSQVFQIFEQSVDVLECYWSSSRLSDMRVFWSPSCVSSAKSSHPKKTGCTTKNTSSTSSLHPRGAKDADAVAPNGRKDARTNRKSEPPASSVPQKTSETPGQPAELKPSSRLSHGISTSLSDREAAQGASGLEPPPKVSAASEEGPDGGAPEPQRGAPGSKNAAEDTSCTRGELDCSCRGERPGRTPGEGGEDQRESEEEERSDQSSLR